MNQLRLNPLTDRWATVATGRASRPEDFAQSDLPVEADPNRPCPFCPGHEEETPPALETYGPDGQWLLRVVPNRYPAFEGTGDMKVQHLGPLFAQAPATGIHEVLVFTPDHDASWATLGDRQAGLTMAALRDRMEDHAHASGVRYSQAIVNHGRESGASLAHPHAQLLGIPFVPGEILEEVAGFERFAGGCLLCATIDAERAAGHRVVSDKDGVVVLTPWWSGSPFEVLIVPEPHEGHVRNAVPGDLAAVGRAVRNVTASLTKLLGDVAYNVMVHTLPHHAADPFHWHVHIVPRLQSLGGFEQGTGAPINIVSPEEACEFLSD